MSSQVRRLRSWTLWNERRVPSEYEVVTYKLNYHFRRRPTPFEMSPEWPLQQWYLRYREGSVFNVDDWEGFRDPHALTYRRYIELRHEREVYIDSLIDDFEARRSYSSLGPDWLEFLRDVYFPSRFAGHALQMSGEYIAQMSPSAFVANPFHFQAADEMRRIQRTAYLAKAIALETGREDLASSDIARERWEESEAWQPLRELLERHLCVYDWGEAFAVRNLVVKPLYDTLFNVELADLARAHDDDLLALIHEDFQLSDGQYARDVTGAMVSFATSARPELRAWLVEQVRRWHALAEAAVAGVARGFAQTGSTKTAEEISHAVLGSLRSFHRELGLADG